MAAGLLPAWSNWTAPIETGRKRLTPMIQPAMRSGAANDNSERTWLRWLWLALALLVPLSLAARWLSAGYSFGEGAGRSQPEDAEEAKQ
jgi:hypothetical protein